RNQCGLTHGGTIRTENSGTNKTEITGTDSPKWLAWFDPKYPEETIFLLPIGCPSAVSV
ncbi:MAG: hypothetical protein HN921_16220, partial [Bacteroidetes bacterium]|nr:hypothetical protein [Bacteroidota bacterium]